MDAGDVLFGLTLLAAIGAGLVAGAFYAFSTFVMPGLRRLPARDGAAAMQQINITAVTPGFMAAFMGTATLGLAVGVWGVADAAEDHGRWLISGAVLYLLGSFGLTVGFHVPRNNALQERDPDAEDTPRAWDVYYADWVRWNHVRAAASVGALVAFVIAMVEMP